jgi:transcriptional regulator with XRE-family HTH domain
MMAQSSFPAAPIWSPEQVTVSLGLTLFRVRGSMSQKQLAKESGVDIRTIQRIEQGKILWPTPEVVDNLAWGTTTPRAVFLRAMYGEPERTELPEHVLWLVGAMRDPAVRFFDPEVVAESQLRERLELAQGHLKSSHHEGFARQMIEPLIALRAIYQCPNEQQKSQLGHYVQLLLEATTLVAVMFFREGLAKAALVLSEDATSIARLHDLVDAERAVTALTVTFMKGLSRSEVTDMVHDSRLYPNSSATRK